MKKNWYIGLISLIIILIISSCYLFAQDGSLDLSFGKTGKVTTTIGNNDDEINAVALQSDGKIVAAGYSYNGSNHNFALARYNTDGSLDNSFGTDGKVTTAIGSSDDFAYAVALQSDGKIVAAGYSYNGSNYDFALARYNTDGSFDNSFGTNGKVITAIGSSDDEANAVALQSDGKIVAAGYSYNGSNYDFALARYNTDGSLDTGFGTDGILTTAIGSNNDNVYALALQSDGKIVVAGRAYKDDNYDFALARYNTDGSLNTGFGTDGIVTTAIGSNNDNIYALALQSDGKIVVAGRSDNGSNDDFALARYDTNGSLDTGFGTDGIVTTAIRSSDDVAYAMALQSDGKIVVAGKSDNGSNDDFALVRYNTDGSLDDSYGIGEKLTTAIGSGSDVAHAVALQSDGKIIAAGLSYNEDSDFALARYNTNGSLDDEFGAGTGKRLTDIKGYGDEGSSLAIQDDGKLVIAGSSEYDEEGGNAFAVVRYKADGSLDKGFGTDGKVITEFEYLDADANSVALQRDGKIVVAGYSYNGSNDDFVIVRYNIDGSLDTDFGTGGKVVTALREGNDVANKVAIQSDGKIVAVGYSNNGSDNDFALVRYNENGSLDESFGTGGKVIIPIGSGDEGANALAIQNDGKIVIGGFSFNGSNNDFAIVRCATDGSLDIEFGTNGIVTTAIGSSYESCMDIAIDGSGKIVAVGNAMISSQYDIALVRYNTNGTLDTDFGTSGIVTTSIGSGDDYGEALALSLDGKIIVTGSSYAGSQSNFVAVRYNSNGSIDTDFGSDKNGKVILNVGSGSAYCYTVGIQNDGQIVLAGTANNGLHYDFAVACLNGSSAPLPVELTTFTVSVVNNHAMLYWRTETEVHNYGFEVERRLISELLVVSGKNQSPINQLTDHQWLKIGFVQGAGTSNSPKEYSFTDSKLPAGRYEYRLKQIDLDGKFKYSQSVEVEVGNIPTEFTLYQNYPNPFNPNTTIKYDIPAMKPFEGFEPSKGSLVSLRVYDILGKEVATLVNEQQPAGSYEVKFDASKLASGVYFYKLATGYFISVKKLLLMK